MSSLQFLNRLSSFWGKKSDEDKNTFTYGVVNKGEEASTVRAPSCHQPC